MNVEAVPLLQSVTDISAGNRKIPASAFLASGELAVVDQGRELVGGWTNDGSSRVAETDPVIVFGDHTRVFKYVDFPFAIGADGVKVLRPGKAFHARYLYHFLTSQKLPNAGYSRHFKFLKEIQVPKPPLEEQRRIAAILDKADALRVKRRQELVQLDDLIDSTFLATFDQRSVSHISAAVAMPRMRNGVSPSTGGTYLFEVLTLSAVTGGRFDETASKRGQFAIEPPAAKRVRAGDFLMCRGNGNKSLVGVGVYSSIDRPELVFPDTVIAGRVDETVVLLPFLERAWRQPKVRAQIEALARTTNGTFKINQQSLAGIQLSCPPLNLQRRFADAVSAVERMRTEVEAASAVERDLFESLQSRAFRGDL